MKQSIRNGLLSLLTATSFLLPNYRDEIYGQERSSKVVVNSEQHSFANSPGYIKNAFEISEIKTRNLMNKVLDTLDKDKDVKFPVENFKDSRYVRMHPKDLAHFRADYSGFLEDRLYDTIPIIGGEWRVQGLSGLDGLYKPIFLNREAMNFVVYSLKDMKIKNNVRIKLFNPKGEEIIDSRGFGYRLEKSKEEDFGVYTTAFIYKDNVWQVRQFRVVPDNDLGKSWAHFKNPLRPLKVPMKKQEIPKAPAPPAPSPGR